MNNIEHHIRDLEEKLLHGDVRANPELLDELLADDFEEVGSSGKISDRREVIEWLVAKEKDAAWSLTEFRIRQLSPELVLAIYHATKMTRDTRSRGSLRSSIWKLTGAHWKMVFHQGTGLQDE